VLHRIINPGGRNCSCCVWVELKEGTEVYACIDCDWMMCHFCHQLRIPRGPSASVATWPITPEFQEMKFRRKNDDTYYSRMSSFIGEKPLPGQDKSRVNRATGFEESIKSVSTTASRHHENDRTASGIRSINSPERILHDINKIRNTMKTVAEMKSPSSIGSRSPRDYTPRRWRKSRLRSSCSESSSQSWSDCSDISPYRRRSRRYRRRRRRLNYD